MDPVLVLGIIALINSAICLIVLAVMAFQLQAIKNKLYNGFLDETKDELDKLESRLHRVSGTTKISRTLVRELMLWKFTQQGMPGNIRMVDADYEKADKLDRED